jgi:hypothetical protein
MMGVKAGGCSGRKGVVLGFKIGNYEQGGARRVVRCSLGWFGSGLWFGRAEATAGLVKMAFGCGKVATELGGNLERRDWERPGKLQM